MIFIILAILIGIAIGIKLSVDDVTLGVDLECMVMGFTIGVLGSMVFLVWPFMLLPNHFYKPHDTSYSFNIIAADDGSQTHGRFFLFAGALNSENYYFYYKQDPHTGAIKQGKVLVDDTELYQDATADKAYIHVKRTTGYMTWLGPTTGTFSPKYEIHIPPKSVQQKFNFDLQGN